MRLETAEIPQPVLDTVLDNGLYRDVLARFELPGNIWPTLNHLRRVYAAWCKNIPFDNIRKLIYLNRAGERMPSLDPNDFFDNWLANGSGGTCWPSSNALWSLLNATGFDARRVAGSMFDIEMVNHGTVKVNIDDEDWMLDTSILSNIPLPMDRGIYIHDAPNIGVEVEPFNGSHVIWIDFPPLPSFVPCRLRIDPVDSVYYHERYEVFSREQSPFNSRLYFRKGSRSGASLVFGNVRIARIDGGLEVKEFSPAELLDHLRKSGVSHRLIDEWVASGGLDACFDPSTQPPAPEIAGLPPSRRSQ